MTYPFNHIIIRDCFYGDNRKKIVRTYSIDNEGVFSRLRGLEGSFDLSKAEKKEIRTLTRGELLATYEALLPEVSNKNPAPAMQDYSDHHIELYLYIDDQCLYQDESGNPLPSIVSYHNNLYIGGYDTETLLWGKKDSRVWYYGADVLEAFFDIRIPEGCEALALYNLNQCALSSKDKELFQHWKEFLEWLLHGKGLIEIDEKLYRFFKEKRDIIAENFRIDSFFTYTEESAMVEGARFFRGMGYSEESYALLKRCAEKCKSSLACRSIVSFALSDNDMDTAFRYGAMGASLGDPEACLITERICQENKWKDLADFYCKLGVERGSGDCYGLAALYSAEKASVNLPKGPVEDAGPFTEAIDLAKEGIYRRSAKSMTFLAQAIMDIGSETVQYIAPQLLHRAEAMGEVSSYFYLGLFYFRDHELAGSKNLALAETYAKKAMAEDEDRPEDSQVLLADIYIEQGKVEEGVYLLADLATNGYEKAIRFLGTLLSGIDKRYPAEYPLPRYAYKKRLSTNFFKAMLWRRFPWLVSAEEAIELLNNVPEDDLHAAYHELSVIYSKGPEELRNRGKAYYYRSHARHLQEEDTPVSPKTE